MHRDDLVDGDDNPIDLDTVIWKEYKINVLVPKDHKESPLEDLMEALPFLKFLHARMQERDPRFTMQEWFAWDLHRSWEVEVNIMGPSKEVAICSRGHITSIDEVDHCEQCQSDAELAYEQRLNR